MAEHVTDNPDGSSGRRRWRIATLELNAIALMASTGITALVGLGFWAIAARLPPAEVGRTSAILSSATMLSQLASSNIGVLFGRVLASAGRRSRSVVLAGYASATVIGGVLGLGFILFYAGDQLFLSPWERGLFPVLVILFGIFALQDWVLIGVRGSAWVPVEQLLFSIGKLGLLLWFAAEAVTGGIVLAWAIPCLLTVIVINPILIWRILPNRPPPPASAGPMPSVRELAKIFLAEYATGTTSVITPLLLPLLVVGMLGTTANAYYALPWLIAESLSLLNWNISSSYMVEAAHDRSEQAALMRRTFRLSALVCGLGIPFLLIAAPWLLGFLGSGYVTEGSGVLRLMVLAIPFNVIETMYINSARVRNQMGRIVALQILTTAVVIGLAVVLLPRVGVDGAGWAYLVAEAASAALVIVPVVRWMREGRAPGGSQGAAPGTRPDATPDASPDDTASPTMPIAVASSDETRPMTAVTRGPST